MDAILKNKIAKKKCQIFTPDNIVKTMLDLANYKDNVIGLKVLENSYGSGNILKPIVERYIKESLKKKISTEDISKNLEQDIYGIELDSFLYKQSKLELDMILKKYNLPAVKWRLFNDNALFHQYQIKFDLIIGNPPYINYNEIDNESKKKLKKEFSVCKKGKFDYCYAFIESAICNLNDRGKLIQLIPSSIFKNVFAAQLRAILKKHLVRILDFRSLQIFPGILISSSIFLYDKSTDLDFIKYTDKIEKITAQISKKKLKEKWSFIPSKTISKDELLLRFGDYFNSSIVVATLLNEAFVVNDPIIKDYNLEKSILKNTASPRSIRYKKKESIIFPYKYCNNNLTKFDQTDFEEKFPNASSYLKRFIDKLKARKSDKNAKWFEYGRTQALAHLNAEKLLLSTIITNNVDIHILDKNTIPYSGIFITKKETSPYSIEDAKKILISKEFKQHIKNIGINVNGKSIRITCKDISNFYFKGYEKNGKINI